MRIAIIDDGVNPEYIANNAVVLSVKVDDDRQVVQTVYDSDRPISHGTICAMIIDKYCRDVNLVSIKVLDEKTDRGELYRLINAIDWCSQNDIQIINLSLGSTYPKDFKFIKKAVKRAIKNNITIVAATANRNEKAYPACMKKVIGVRKKEALPFEQTGRQSGIDVEEQSVHLLNLPDGNSFMTPPSNSFAAAYVTALTVNESIINGKA